MFKKVISKGLSAGLMLVAMAQPGFAEGGHGAGNGGGGHVCGSNVEFYDLFAGREVYNYKMVEEPGLSIDQTIQYAVTKTYETYPALARLIQKAYNDNIQGSAPGQFNPKVRIGDLEPESTIDASNLYHRRGCRFEQMIDWDESTGMIVINADLWNALPNDFERGVAFFHEVAYKVARDVGSEKTSDKVRKFVAEVFSDQKTITTEIVPNPYLRGGFLPQQGDDLAFVVGKAQCKSDRYEVDVIADSETLLVNNDGESAKLKPGRDGSSHTIKNVRFPFRLNLGHYVDTSINKTRRHKLGGRIVIRRPDCGERFEIVPSCYVIDDNFFGQNYCAPMTLLQDLTSQDTVELPAGKALLEMRLLSKDSLAPNSEYWGYYSAGDSNSLIHFVGGVAKAIVPQPDKNSMLSFYIGADDPMELKLSISIQGYQHVAALTTVCDGDGPKWGVWRRCYDVGFFFPGKKPE